jgi:hypothetical protein
VTCHQRQCLVQVLLGLDSHQLARRDLVDLHRLRIPSFGDRAHHDVAIGQDPGQAAFLDDRHRPDILALHRFRGLRERLRWAHCLDGRRHHISHVLCHLLLRS